MEFHLIDQDQKKALESHHRRERDGRVRDRIKAVLLKSEGWADTQIAQALRLHEETIRQHLKDWSNESKLRPENGGSKSKLTIAQTQALKAHLDEQIYTQVSDICAYVFKRFKVTYTVSGMTKWLHEHGFRYKRPKGVPAKADLAQQEAFIDEYLALLDTTPVEEPIVFMDSAHPTMATKVTCGWIKKGVDKPIAQTASRTRVNVMGAIELASMKVTSCCPESVNTQTTVAFFDQLKASYPEASTLHVILDQAGYHRSQETQNAAKEKGIMLHYLPPYSPNLNPIERLWKVMHEQVRNNVFFASAKAFRSAIARFFEEEILIIKNSLRNRINDNFQTIKPVPSG